MVANTLPSSWFPLQPHPKQYAAYTSKARFVNLACGRGSGKTELARRYVVRHLPINKKWPDPIYFYALPTFNMAKRIAWDKIKSLIPERWIDSVNVGELRIKTIFGSELYVLGLDKPERAEGVQWDGGVIDESCDIKPGTFDRSLMPAFTHRNAWCWRIGVPKRVGIGAVEFKEFFDKGLSGEDPTIESYSWTTAEILKKIDPERLRDLKRILSPKDYNEQCNANWETAGGSVFHSFNETYNVKPIPYIPGLPIVVGCDFNVDPMCWVLGHVFNNCLYIFDEIAIRNIDTASTLQHLFEMYGTHKAGWHWYGDAASSQRNTSTAVSDYLLIHNDHRFINKEIFIPAANPSLADRFAACNGILKNAIGDVRCFIDPKCKVLIKDMKARSYKENTRLPQDGAMIGHISDAFGYIAAERFPVKLISVEPEVHEASIINMSI